MNVAVLTAGGSGTRMNNNIPKQFLTVNDIPIIIYTLRSFQCNERIDKIVVACLKAWQPALESYKKEFSITKLDMIVDGGNEGSESISNCLDGLTDVCSDDDIIIIHDGNRPFVSHEVIDDAIKVCMENGNAVAVTPSTEVLVEDKGNRMLSIKSLSRDDIKRTQTPHVFLYGDLKRIYAQIKQKGLKPVATCDAAIALGIPIHLSVGSALNFKITTQEDLKLFRSLINHGEVNV